LRESTVETDGGPRGNPGPGLRSRIDAATGETLAEVAEYGVATNNVAEYSGPPTPRPPCGSATRGPPTPSEWIAPRGPTWTGEEGHPHHPVVPPLLRTEHGETPLRPAAPRRDPPDPPEAVLRKRRQRPRAVGHGPPPGRARRDRTGRPRDRTGRHLVPPRPLPRNRGDRRRPARTGRTDRGRAPRDGLRGVGGADVRRGPRAVPGRHERLAEFPGRRTHRRRREFRGGGPPGGAARDKLLAAHTGRTVLLVSHVTPIKTLVRLALGAPPEALFRMELSAASLSVVAYYGDGNASVRLLNDTTPLR
jgi:hypothetical protein